MEVVTRMMKEEECVAFNFFVVKKYSCLFTCGRDARVRASSSFRYEAHLKESVHPKFPNCPFDKLDHENRKL